MGPMAEHPLPGSIRPGGRGRRGPALPAILLVTLASASLAAATTSPRPAAARTLAEALVKGDIVLDARYRYETVDQPDLFDDEGTASTLRLRLGYRTRAWYGFYAYADLESNTSFRSESYNSTENGKTWLPVIADPQDTELNAAYLAYGGYESVTFQLGRQVVELDNQRFVGTVDWRQLQQTFDAYTVRARFFRNMGVFLGRLNNANRVFGEHHPNTAPSDPSLEPSSALDLAADLVNISFETRAGKLTAYGYFLELEDVPAASHQDLGVRFAGEYPLTEGSMLSYAAEYATQSAYKDAPDTVDADYRLLELGIGLGKLGARFGRELLTGDGTYAFQTPLATLHGFNGWADQFTVIPPTGLEDRYVTVEMLLGRLKLQGVWHDFAADEGDSDYGSEVDLLAELTYREIYSFLVKYAKYEADDFATDTRKFWLQIRVKF